jgi:hypothetical protein
VFQSASGPRRTAAAGAIALGMAIAISSAGIVRAAHIRPANSKSFSCSSGTACLTGKATGAAAIGVKGANTATSGHAYGVEGKSSNGDGVYGFTRAKVASNPQAGVYGAQENTVSDSGDGVFAESADTTQVYEALYAKADVANDDILWAVNDITGESCTIDGNANLTCGGSGEARSLRLRHRTSAGSEVLTSGSESVSATLEDSGSARLVDGVANVALDPAFAAAIGPSALYHVFLTPTGDTRGLYVSAKTPATFVVREIQGGRSTISFDYRIVGRPLDTRSDRLAPAPAAPRNAVR